MTGGAGNDTYVVDSTVDVVTEAGQRRQRHCQHHAEHLHAWAPTLENLTFTGTGAFTGTGNALTNVITGSATGNNILDDGGAGGSRRHA